MMNNILPKYLPFFFHPKSSKYYKYSYKLFVSDCVNSLSL